MGRGEAFLPTVPNKEKKKGTGKGGKPGGKSYALRR